MAAAPWNRAPYTLRALCATYGTLWVLCDVLRRYAPLNLTGILDVDYRAITFSCSKCGRPAWMAISDPSQDAGMSDYCLDPVSDAKHHPDDIKRLSGEPEVAPRLGPKHYGIKMPAR